MLSVSVGGKVVYRAEKAECQPFPVLGNERFLKGCSRNFEGFGLLDFLAAGKRFPISHGAAGATSGLTANPLSRNAKPRRRRVGNERY